MWIVCGHDFIRLQPPKGVTIPPGNMWRGGRQNGVAQWCEWRKRGWRPGNVKVVANSYYQHHRPP